MKLPLGNEQYKSKYYAQRTRTDFCRKQLREK